VWNISGLVPESFIRPRLAAALSIALGAAACGPSGGGETTDTYAIQFILSVTPAQLTALEFTVEYTGGSFVGSDTDVDCVRLANAGDSGEFDDDDAGILTVIIDSATKKLTDDLPIVKCKFEALSQPSSGNFTITVDDAEPSDPNDVTVVVGDTEPASSAGLGEVTE